MRPAVVVHQPHFLPWLGYYSKLANADVFILQDNVQFRRRYYQNRTLIRSPQGTVQWLTIPVCANRTTLIRDVVVATPHWTNTARRALQHSYGSLPYFAQHWDVLDSALRRGDRYLVDICEATLSATLGLLQLSPTIARLSALDVRGTDPTANIVNACAHFAGRTYIFGEGGGRARHSESRIQASGIQVRQQLFRCKFEKTPEAEAATVTNVSIVEFIFRYGPANTRALIERCWRLEEV